ncbi:MAG: DUF4351 domain-containing protein [Pelatocladus maniniholoensis HA4357-MV3]|uniref:DUF4351 domain-containing protein n=1 Tax=Pelatocladus maniniholoensis HA4357-MV3 TaxID=1117104 RepID=A0A9E3HCM3_9NOST|nr:DUF4351 domain-containing protein [Pelatocladus maniniholoensis HA4357-MV3]BAZ66627.1 hypothetical protein NIES4106_13790 [Fischerella sp. NIES-4106]
MSYDNACKYLAEQYPIEFVRWLLGVEPQHIEVLKTELTLEPIRADSVTFLQAENQILHLEIPDREKKQNIAGCIEILAGLRFEKDLIRNFLREDIMRESVIYQDILQKGRKQGEESLILRQLHRRFGEIDSSLIERLRGLSAEQLENLGEALLDFSNVADLIAYLEQLERS